MCLLRRLGMTRLCWKKHLCQTWVHISGLDLIHRRHGHHHHGSHMMQVPSQAICSVVQWGQTVLLRRIHFFPCQSPVHKHRSSSPRLHDKSIASLDSNFHRVEGNCVAHDNGSLQIGGRAFRSQTFKPRRDWTKGNQDNGPKLLTESIPV